MRVLRGPRAGLAVFFMVLVAGCSSLSREEPSGGVSTVRVASTDRRSGNLSSAATPGIPLGGQAAETERILDEATKAIAAMPLPESESGYQEFRIEAPSLVFTCQYSPGGAGDEVPLLACKFGEYVNTMTGHALFWYDGENWRAQLYPQAEEALAQKRHQFFSTLGANCPVGCGSVFQALRQSGTELLAVVDLSGVAARRNQEVHLLKRDGQRWRLLWAPVPDALRFHPTPPVSLHPVVALSEQGIDQFTVTYHDGSAETWVRTGETYAP